MSEAAPETKTQDADLPPVFESPFASLMGIMVPEEGAAPAGEGAATGGADGAAAGSAAPAGEGAPAADGAPAAPAVGADGKPAVPGEPAPADGGAPAGDAADAGTTGAAPVVGGVPDSWTADVADLAPRIGELSSALETRLTEGFQASALTEVREEHGQYFAALEKHPRLLVGTSVPSLTGEGEETLRDSTDAAEWQEAVKGLLVAEVKARTNAALEENSNYLGTLHQSIDLFKNNKDLVPGTKGFDVELANKFTELAKSFEVRVDDKLHGYSIPVQPLIDQLRAQLVASRAAAPAATSTPATGAAPGAPVDPPQAGIQSKAGQGEEKESFSTLFGTLGLPNLVI